MIALAVFLIWTGFFGAAAAALLWAIDRAGALERFADAIGLGAEEPSE